jgi:hypothetical protein
MATKKRKKAKLPERMTDEVSGITPEDSEWPIPEWLREDFHPEVGPKDFNGPSEPRKKKATRE